MNSQYKTIWFTSSGHLKVISSPQTFARHLYPHSEVFIVNQLSGESRIPKFKDLPHLFKLILQLASLVQFPPLEATCLHYLSELLLVRVISVDYTWEPQYSRVKIVIILDKLREGSPSQQQQYQLSSLEEESS